MKIIGVAMLVVPVVGMFLFCSKDVGIKRTAIIFGVTLGGLAVLFGWYMIALWLLR